MCSPCTFSDPPAVRRHLEIWLGTIALLAVALAGTPAEAIDWESLVMPGPVITGHADTEKDCKACHTPFSRDEQRKLCLDCHDKVAADIDGRRGFHGRSAPARTSQCRNCHTDHEGRTANVVRLDPQTFNHAFTDFALEGGHKGLACASCHEARKKHRDAPSTCIGCHAENDVHRKSLGEDCASCHSMTSWKAAGFDHANATSGRYPLKGAHAKVECTLCHAGQRFKNTPTECASCHRIDDLHGGQRGTACQDCHDTAGWKEARFDHLRETGFPLTAGHAGIACQACHSGGDFRKTAGKECVACHRSDDAHQGRNGTDCKTCHSTETWSKASFDHARDTKFALLGAHQQLVCVACHKGEARSEKLQTDCVACHRGDDAHRGKLGTQCGDCHRQDSWREAIRFDHDITKFPLAGMHATTACESCHTDRSFAGTPSGCIDCHGGDDAHKGKLGENCAECHTPNDWRIWIFDHATQTRFALDGAHARLDCVACHLRPPGEGRNLSLDCGSCHRRDDVHGGQFGTDCARCHNTRGFGGARRMPR
jgi:hypothetical protein